MTKKFITGDLTQMVTIDEGGTWVLAAGRTIAIPAPPAPGTTTIGIALTAGAVDPRLVVNGDIIMAGATNIGILIDSQKARVTIGADSTIEASTGIASGDTTTGIDMVNAGTINGGFAGIYQHATHSHIVNEASGKIHANYAVIAGGDDGRFAFVNRGEIIGALNSFVVEHADADIRNVGTISGDILLGDGNDRFDTRFGAFDGEISGGTGDDLYVLKTAATIIHENAVEGIDLVKIGGNYALGDNIENLTLLGAGDFNATGNQSANVITGNAGDNQILGLAGNDGLKGGRGNDQLTGGLDADTFIFNRNSDVDTVRDFSQAEHDRIQLAGWKTIDSFHDLSGHISQNGDNAVIDFGDGDRLVISSFDADLLTKADFLF